MYIIAVFKSRSESIRFAEKLKNYGVFNAVINTPRNVAKGCGLSVKFPSTNQPQARFILANGNYRTFIGFFSYHSTRSF